MSPLRQAFFLVLWWTEPPFEPFFTSRPGELGSCHSAPKAGTLAPPPPTPHANATDGVTNMSTTAIGMPNKIRMGGLLLAFPQRAMSALPPKADMCSAPTHVRYGPIADSCSAAKRSLFDHLVGAAEKRHWEGDAD